MEECCKMLNTKSCSSRFNNLESFISLTKGEIVPEWNCVSTVGGSENGPGGLGGLAGGLLFFVYEDPQHKCVWIGWGADIV